MLSNLKLLALISSVVIISSCTKKNNIDKKPEKIEKFIIEKPFTDFSLVNNRQVVAEQSDGKIILVIQDGELKRISKDGVIDASFTPPTFDLGSQIADIAVQKDDKIIVVGRFYGNVIRLNKDGSFDNSFTPYPISNGFPNIVKIQEDGKILVAGFFFYTQNGVQRANIIRLNSNGSYDDSFSADLQINVNMTMGINCALIDRYGKIFIAGGELFNGIYNKHPLIMCLNANGTLDNSFNFNLMLSQPFNYPRVFSIAKQSDGKILVAGAIEGVGPDYDHCVPVNSIFRLNTDGTVDNSFTAVDSVKTDINTIQVMKDDRLLISRPNVGLWDSSFFRIFNRNGELSNFRIPVPKGFISRIIMENDSTFLLVGSFADFTRSYGLLRLKRILE